MSQLCAYILFWSTKSGSHIIFLYPSIGCYVLHVLAVQQSCSICCFNESGSTGDSAGSLKSLSNFTGDSSGSLCTGHSAGNKYWKTFLIVMFYS